MFSLALHVIRRQANTENCGPRGEFQLGGEAGNQKWRQDDEAGLRETVRTQSSEMPAC